MSRAESGPAGLYHRVVVYVLFVILLLPLAGTLLYSLSTSWSASILPDGLTLTGDDGYTRAHFRTKFWAEAPHTYGDIVFQPDALPEHVARTPLSAQQKDQLLHYGEDQPLLFIGHYWRRGRPADRGGRRPLRSGRVRSARRCTRRRRR